MSYLARTIFLKGLHLPNTPLDRLSPLSPSKGRVDPEESIPSSVRAFVSALIMEEFVVGLGKEIGT